MSAFFGIAFIAAGLGCGWVLGRWHGALMARLREQHPETWRRLGRPHSAPAGWTWTTLLFLFSRHPQQLDDPQFSAALRRFRTGFVLWPLAGIIVVLLSGWLQHR